MEQPGTSGAYEVRCHRCQCSFAPGTRRCLHCGGPLGEGLAARLRLGGSGGELGEPAGTGEEGAPQVPSFARAVIWLVSAGVAVLLSVLQTCGSSN